MCQVHTDAKETVDSLDITINHAYNSPHLQYFGICKIIGCMSADKIWKSIVVWKSAVKVKSPYCHCFVEIIHEFKTEEHEWNTHTKSVMLGHFLTCFSYTCV